MRNLLSLLILITAIAASAQIGGTSAFTFALIENSAKHTALGGISITNTDADPSSGFQNPALINHEMHKSI